MELQVKNTFRPRGTKVQLPAYRAGDVALFCVWGAFAVSAGIGAFEDAAAHGYLAALHRMMVAAVFLLNATLFLLRGPAVRRGEGMLPKLIAFVGTWTAIPLSLLPMTWETDWVLGLTSAGMIAAYAFVLWSLLTLRRSFSIFPEARTLIRHGPYALVRHPLYAAYMMTYVLIALPRFGLLAILLAAVGIGGEVLRARYEEGILAASFPDYADYAAETPRFVPRVK